MSANLSELERLIGYEFSDKALLLRAFTHSSYVNEHDAEDNERLEFLGDCVLGLAVGEKLYASDIGAGEGKLSARRAAIVSRGPLARLVVKLGLERFLRVGAGVDKSAFSDKARSDLYEALVGAVYVDGGMDACRALLDRTFFCNVEPQKDYKTELQERAVRSGLTVTYSTESAADGFVSIVTVGDRTFTGTGKTKHAAQIDAAKHALGAD